VKSKREERKKSEREIRENWSEEWRRDRGQLLSRYTFYYVLTNREFVQKKITKSWSLVRFEVNDKTQSQLFQTKVVQEKHNKFVPYKLSLPSLL